MFQILIKKIKSLYKTDKGGVLIFVALFLAPLFLMLGLATDSSFGLTQKRKLQMACDAAAKAGVTNGNGVTATITSKAQNVFAINTAGMSGITGPNVSVDSNGNVTVSASIVIPTTFMKLGGINSATYNATATASTTNGNVSEMAIAIDVSQNSINGGFLSAAIPMIINFINNLPENMAVSIVPYSTTVQFDPANTNPSALFGNLSSTATDELSIPALFPMSSKYAWNFANFSTVYDFFYGTSFPNKTSYYPLSGTCPSGKAACSTLYPGTCSGGWQSCTSNYSYFTQSTPPMLPLTTNRTVINNYLTNLGKITTGNNGSFPSLISWAWRTIAPEWSGFFQVNDMSNTTTRTTGTYPKAYAQTAPKTLLIITSQTGYWDDMKNINNLYTTACGSSSATWTSKCKAGYPCFNKQKWLMTNYGIAPLTQNIAGNNDGTCDNYDYKTIDQSFGLNLSTKSFLYPANNATTYMNNILSESLKKVNRICSNIQSTGTSVYVIAAGNSHDFDSCASFFNIYYMVKTSKLESALSNVCSSVRSNQTNWGHDHHH
jgi:Flp pilus assembly protein TadG